MKDIAIFGAGGLGKEIACAILKKQGEWNFIGFFDDGRSKGDKISQLGDILGGIEELNNWSEELNIIIGIGNVNVLKSIYNKINNNNIIFPNFIFPENYCADIRTFNIGKGNIIMRDCWFSCDVLIGDFNIFNSSVSIGHDTKMGSFNMLMPAVRVSGEVKIGDYNFFGVGSIVLQQLKIGSNVRLGAGGILMTKPKDNSLYIGNPAKMMKF